MGVNGPYSVILELMRTPPWLRPATRGIRCWSTSSGLSTSKLFGAPAIAGAFVLTTRGGDFDLHIGQDASIGYISHTDALVRLYLQETLTFLLLTDEAAVALAPPPKAKKA